MLAKNFPQIGRIPPDLKELLKEVAKMNDRSLNQEVVNRLKKSLLDEGLLNGR